MYHRQDQPNRAGYLLIAGLALTLFGCSEPNGEQSGVNGIVQHVDTPETKGGQQLKLVPYGRSYLEAIDQGFGTEDPPVPGYELDCIVADFPVYFSLAPNAINPISPAYVDVNWKSLSETIDPIGFPDPGYKRGVRIHYGLRSRGAGAYEISFALEIVKLDFVVGDVWDITKLPNSFYAVVGGDLSRTDEGTWTDDDLYFSNVHVRRSNQVAAGTFQKVVYGFDNRSYLFHWERQLKEMKIDNPTLTKIRLHCTAEPYDRIEGDAASGADDVEFDMRHNIAGVGYNAAGVPLLNNIRSTSITDYTLKAADVGSPCPPRCKKAYLPAKGVPVRRNCTAP